MTAGLTSLALPTLSFIPKGFIGLVVALSILILVCCTAVFFLLRNHEPTEQDRAIRRERYRRQREETSSSTAPSHSAIGSLGEKFKRMWRRDSTGSGSNSGRRRGGRGWIQAGSGDEWESDSDRGGDPELAGGRRRAEAGQMMQAFPIPTSRENTEDHARVVESPLSESGSGSGFIPVHYTDPFAKDSPTSHMSPSRSQSPLSLSSPREEASAEDDLDVRPPDHRHLSTLSTTSVRTSGGSKFIEEL